MNVGDRVRVTEEGSPLSGFIGIVEELPSGINVIPAEPETAFASVRFQGIVPATWRCDMSVLAPAITPGQYLAKRRTVAGVPIEALPIADTAVRAIEADERFPYDAEIFALQSAFPFDISLLVEISAGQEPRICRQCACSEFDPCEDAFGDGCAWVEADLCSACLNACAGPSLTGDRS